MNDTATVTHAVAGGDYGTVTASDVAVTVTDDETVSTGVVLSVNPETVSEDAGATVVTVTGTLNHAPRLAETVVTLTVGATTDTATEGTDYGTIGSLTLTIAAGSASGTQTFTLLPTDDDVAGADRALTVDGSVTGLDVTAAAVTIEEDDERGVTVTPTSLAVPEAGSGTYTVALTSQPTGTVTVTPSVSGNSEVTVSGALTFTRELGHGAAGDGVGGGDTDAVNDTATVTHAVAGGDYGTVTASDVAVTVTDDETVSTGVVLSVNPETVSEDAGATVVTVTGTLNHAPRLAETVVTLTVGATTDTATEGTDYGTIGSLTLTIAAGSASGTQTFTLLPTDDDVAGADRALTVDGSVTGLDVTAAAVTIEEDDERGVTVTPTSLAVPEAGSGTYTVALTSQPTGTVTVTPSVSGNSEVTVSGALTFTASDWGTAQTVTVSAQDDADAVNDTATVTHAVAGGDYGTVTASDVAVTVTDDETVSTGVVLSVNPETVSEDAGATVVTVTGTLNHAPRLAETVVTLTVGATTDTATEGTDYGTIGSLTLTIAAGSASGTQTFTLLPTDDDVAGADRALTVDGSVTGLDVTAAAVTIEEDDERGVTVTPTSLAVPEAGSGTYTVALTSQPTGTVTVTPSVSGNSEVTVSGALTFTTVNWGTAQPVTVSAAADTDAVNDTATVTHAVAGGDYGTVTASDVAVTVTDDETVSTGVVLSVNPETVSEDAGATVVTVTGTLNHAPRLAETVVTLTVGATTDTATEGTDYGTIGSLTLTIAAGSASGTQTFTLLPTDDDVAGADRALTVDGSVTGLDVTAAAVTIEEDDERGVTVTPTSLAVPEAGSGTYTVALTSQPTGTVTVTPSVSGNSEVTVSGALTFTTVNWGTAQPVTVSAAADTDAVNDTATVTHAVAGGDYGTVTASDVAVTVTDDETVSTGVVLSVNPETVSEDAGATVVTVTGTLNHAPRLAETVVTLTVGATTDTATEGTDYGTIGSLTLTIAAGSASGTQTFTLLPTDDDVAGADRALTVDGSVTGLDVTAAAVTIEEDDERGVTVTPTSLAVPEAGSGTYTVALTSQPTGTVTVTPSVSGNSEVTVSGALTFTTVNWGTAQPVTVSAAADTDAVNDTATVTHAVAGGDYGTVTASDVAVTVTDDETVSTGVVLSVNPETVSEDAGATVVTVTGTLNHAPRLAETVVTLTVGATTDTATEGTDYGTIGSLTLTIAAGSASGTQTFTLLPTDDDVAGADRALTVDGSVTGLDVTAAAVTIEEDDERGVTVTPTSLAVPEAGSGTYTVALTSQPTGTVTVTPSVSGNSEVTVSGALTFTTVNWGTAQPVTVSAAADTDAVNDTATVTHAVAGGDYGTVTASDVAVTVTDDETVSTGVVLSVNPETVSEDAGATVVTVTGTLNHAPRLAETVVTLTVGATTDTATEGTDYGTIGSLTLTIAAGSASGTQTFTLLPTDDDVAGADRALTVDGSVTGLDVTAAAVTIEEDDERGVTVTPTSLAVPEAGSGTYTVALTSQPTGTVTVTPSVSGNSEVTVSGALTFTTVNWGTAQPVTVSAAADTDAVNDTATVTHAVAGGDYGTVTASDVAVTVTDDETVSTGVVLSVNPETVSEDAGATVVTVTGTLNHAPRLAETVVTLTVGATTDTATEGTDYGTIGSLTLTIAAGSASGTQTFTLLPTDDDVAGADRALTVDGSVTGLDVTAAAVTIEEDDERGVTVTPTSLAVPEAGSGTYTVALTSQPTGTVTVTPSVSGNSEVTVSGALTFTTVNWGTAQPVTVSAAADTDAVNDTATVTHAVAGGDYGTVTASDVAVTVTDDETVSTGVVLSVNPETVSEDAGATVVTVTGTLNHAPRLAETVVTLTVGATTDTATEGTDYGTIGSLTLTIAAGSASGTQTFTLLPTDDDVAGADRALTVDGSVTGLDVTAAAVTIEEDDERGVTVTPTSLAVPEAGSGTYTVALTSQPTGTVTVTPSVSGNSEVTVSGALTFTTVNWGTAQPVTVSAAADTDAVNDTATVTHAVAGGDYGTVTASDVAVTVTDDETVSTGVVLSVNPETVSEDAGATVVTVTGTLNHAPRLAETVVTLTVGATTDTATEGTDYGTIGSLTLTIAAGSASGTQTFTLLPTDDDVAGADRALTVDGSVTGLDVTAAAVTIEEDDERGVTVTPTSLAVPEAGSGTYTVALTSQPTGTVTVTPSVSGNSEVTVSGALTFTTVNWGTAQPVTVSAAADTDAVNDTATVTHAVAGGDYGTVTASDVAVTVTDDETVSTEVTLTSTPAG